MTAKAIILGRIGHKEYKTTKDNIYMCRISIATDRHYNTKSGHKEVETSWHNVTFFDKMADVANKYAEVGYQIYIEGNIQHRKKDDKYYYSIIGTHIELLPNKKENNSSHQSSESNAFDEDDDVPF